MTDLPVPPIPPSSAQKTALNDPDLWITDVYNPRLSIVVVNPAFASPATTPDDTPTPTAPSGEIPFAMSAEVVNNNWYQSDRFSAEFSLWADPHYNAGWWDKQNELMLDIRFSTDDSNYTSMIVGRVDHIDMDWSRGIVRIDGRDLTSNFLDHRVYESFQNKTSSQIATELAKKYGMTADVDKTTTPVGRYYEGEHDHLEAGEFSKSLSQWDLLTYLAQHEGNATSAYNVWVSGSTLHFKQAPAIDEAKPWILQMGQVDYQTGGSTRLLSANMESLRMNRAMTLAKDVIVVVRSWNSQHKEAYNVSSPKSGGSSTSKTPGQKWVYTVPNLTKEQAQELAERKRAEISKGERLIEWTDAGGYPGLLTLSPRDILELRGTNSGYDQRYYVDSISRSLNNGGLTVHVRAKNHPTESNVQNA